MAHERTEYIENVQSMTMGCEPVSVKKKKKNRKQHLIQKYFIGVNLLVIISSGEIMLVLILVVNGQLLRRYIFGLMVFVF